MKKESSFFWKNTTQLERDSYNNIMLLEEHNKSTDSVK